MDEQISPPDEKVEAAIKIFEDFEKEVAALQAEQKGLAEITIKAGEARALERVYLWLKKIFSK